MYDKRLETVPGAKEQHDKVHKALAADRMKKVGLKAARIKREKRASREAR